ncbi:MAG: GNAT family N-acetyltransferase [Rubrivivax sp.]
MNIAAEVHSHRVAIHEHFAALRDSEAQLRREEATSDFYASWPWFELLACSGIEPDWRKLLVHVVSPDNHQLCLPLVRRPRSPVAVFGGAVTALSNYYSSLFGPIGDNAALTVSALRAVLRALAAHGGWPAVIDLQPLDEHGVFVVSMERALRAEGYSTDRYLCFGNWHLPVLGRSYAEYEGTLPSRLRNTIKRGRKKLDAAGDWTLDVHREPGAELECGIADWQAIYARSWKVPEPFPEFVPDLCRTAAARGWLRLGVIRFQGRPIAAQLWIVKHGRALIYKLAYDEEYKRFSAGSVLSAELMRRAIDGDGVVDVDYLTGDDDYKRDWMSTRRQRVGLVAFRTGSLTGELSRAKHVLGKLRARWRARKQALPPRPGPDLSDEGLA